MRPRVSTRSVLRALLLVLLAASVPLKLWTLPEARASSQAGDDAIREGMRAFLAEAGFSAQVEAGLVDLPAASGRATAAACCSRTWPPRAITAT